MPLYATAQVIEIDQDGGLRTYSGPASIHADGSVVQLRRPQAARRALTPVPLDAGGFRERAAVTADLSPELIEAVAWRESQFHPKIVSSVGAVGEMQLMPATARALGVDPYDSQQNYSGGAIYLKSLMKRYDGNLVLALAAYNAGPKAVEKYRGVPPYKETRDYVAAVLERLSTHTTIIASNSVGK